MKKILLLGSGALKIGEAGEFDYSGSQALKAFKEEGIKAILVNPNIATVQTSADLAQKIYFLPVTPYFVEKIIQKEKPDAVSLSFGGQTALNCGLALSDSGLIKKNKVSILGTQISSIKITEDRQLFSNELKKIGVQVPRGGFASSVSQAVKVAQKIGFPVIIRSAYSLGGLGSSVVQNQEALTQSCEIAFQYSPQVAIEEYLHHWKELEYEIVRDKNGNKISVCNMENMDPLGIHTGESIVVAPSQTLTNFQYHFLRELSFRVIEHLKIVGECNIQFALDPKSHDYRVIEVNARLSRSSALASKATGYPLAYIACKLGLGYTLPKLKNSVTKSTSAFFEPALDYIVVKIPKWDLQKFAGASLRIGSEMKSVGEVMAIGRSFPEGLQKAVRMIEPDQDGLLNTARDKRLRTLEDFLSPSAKRLFAVSAELAQGAAVEKIYKATGIDPWFLEQIKKVVQFEGNLLQKRLTLDFQTILEAKKLGFSDRLLAKGFNTTETKLRETRKKMGITAKVKHIDTLAAEYPAKTNYLYLSYHVEQSEDIANQMAAKKDKKIIVLGSGPYRIGSSVEFDWCCVTAAQEFRKKGFETTVINCNPETVSTDFDSADNLYFEELTLERVLDILDVNPSRVALAFGGQIPNNLAQGLSEAGAEILGTSPRSIDQAENRQKFSNLLDRLEIAQPVWQKLSSVRESLKFAGKIGYPILIRPSYVLSGSAMNIAISDKETITYLKQATKLSPDFPVVISKFIDNAKEIEIDGVAQNGGLIIYAISEHVENAGVHSGDATMVLPPQRLYLETVRQIKENTKKILKALNITGPFNIQFLAKDNKVMVIELNLRSSRSFPFVSKVTGYNFISIAAKAMLDESVGGDYKTLDLDYVGVKAPQFSFNRIKEADPRLRVEMSSTGEVACFGTDLYEAYLKALLATGWKFPKAGIFMSIGGDQNKSEFLEGAGRFAKLGLKIFATEKTSLFLKAAGINNAKVFKISEQKDPSVLYLLKAKKVDLVINISTRDRSGGNKDGFIIRRSCVDFGIPLVTNLQAANTLSYALSEKTVADLQIKSWDEY